jgi:hypothetical protein
MQFNETMPSDGILYYGGDSVYKIDLYHQPVSDVVINVGERFLGNILVNKYSTILNCLESNFSTKFILFSVFDFHLQTMADKKFVC